MQICGTQFLNRGLWPGCSGQCLEGPLAEGVMLHNCCLKFLRISSLQLCFVCEGQEDNGARAKGLEHSAVSKPPGMTSQSAPIPSASGVTPTHTKPGSPGQLPPLQGQRGPSFTLALMQQGSGHRAGQGQVRIPQLQARWQPSPPALFCQAQEEAHSQLRGGGVGGISPIPHGGSHPTPNTPCLSCQVAN